MPPKTSKKKSLVVNAPVLHEGYVKLFNQYLYEVGEVYVISKDLAKEFSFFEEDIRRVDPKLIVDSIKAIGFKGEIKILDKKSANEVQPPIIMTGDQLSRRIAKQFLPDSEITFDTAFLTWDESHVDTKEPVEFCDVTSSSDHCRHIFAAKEEAEQSSCFWRKVGAIVIKNGRQVLAGHNAMLPSDQVCYELGCIRDYIKPGKKSEVCSAIHAEQMIISKAAEKGISLKDASLYITHFPCPACAKLVALSGIKKCFFARGHASFDGETILKSRKVELIQVKITANEKVH